MRSRLFSFRENMLTSYTPYSDLRSCIRNKEVTHRPQVPPILAASCKQSKGMGLGLFVLPFRHVRE